MTSTFRIPRAEMSGPYAALLKGYSRRWLGQVPDTLYVYWHHRPVLNAVLGFERKVMRWHRLAPDLKAYAELASAARIGCSWCLDFGYHLSREEGLDEAKLSQVPRWRDSTVFSELERAVMEYAEAMTGTPPTVADEQVALLLDRLGEPALVELTQVVALENMRSRFNTAAGLASQGYSASCRLPLATADSGT